MTLSGRGCNFVNRSSKDDVTGPDRKFDQGAMDISKNTSIVASQTFDVEKNCRRRFGMKGCNATGSERTRGIAPSGRLQAQAAE